MKDGFGLITGVNSDPDVEALRDTLVRQKQPKCKGELTSASDVRTLAGTAITVKRVNVTCTDVGNGDDVTEVFSFYPHLSGQLLAVSHVSKDPALATEGDRQFAQRVTGILTAQRRRASREGGASRSPSAVDHPREPDGGLPDRQPA